MMRFRTQIIVVALFLLLGGTTGCKSANQPEKTPAQNKTVTTKAETVSTPAEAETAQSPSGLTIKGKVIDTINAGAYTYLQVQAAQGPVWIAIPQAKVEKGQEVTVQNGMEMKDFKSKILKRTFASIIFASGIGNTQAAGSPHAAAQGGNGFAKALESETDLSTAAATDASGGSLAAIVPSANIKVRKAEGTNGYTIGELFAKRKELNNKEVMVRGKVMKVSRMIMGKNWVHIQDGTGDALKNTHDLVVTTMAVPKTGSVVLVEGVLHADRDFGAGYRYAAIIEDAKIK
ncbi:MAG: DNA-binding protein [Deltaproteobacteria bacterium]|nr:DNA-binding protein [Deltaproteobacteria bacterium]